MKLLCISTPYAEDITFKCGYKKDGNFIYHREDGPAVIRLLEEYANDGCHEYYYHGILYRSVDRHSDRWFDSDGELHREDGPAFRYVSSGETFYYLHGKIVIADNDEDFIKLIRYKDF